MRRTWLVVLWVVALLAVMLPAAQAQRVVVIKVWTIGPDNPSVTRYNNVVSAADRLNADLRREGAGIQVKVEGFFDTTNWDSYLRRVLLGFQSAEGADIVQANGSLNATWADAGFIIPLDAYMPRYRQFTDVVPALWDAMKYKGKVWAVPQDTEARPLYFNKTLLKQLGWSDAQIAALPDRLAKGDFTWDDVMTTAREALQKRVIEAGKGYYHRPTQGPDFIQWYRSFGGRIWDDASGKLVINKAALLRYYSWLRAGVDQGVIEKDRLNGDWNRFLGPATDGKVLFFSGGTWQWAEMAQIWLNNKGGEDWLFTHIGYGPHPTHVKGGKAITMSNPQAYFVSAKSANKDLAVRLLAYTTVPELDAKHAVGSAHLPVLRTTARVINDKFLKSVSYLLNYTTFAPAHPDLTKWQDAVYRGLSAVESGQVTPQQGVDLVVSEMQRTIRDQVIVE